MKVKDLTLEQYEEWYNKRCSDYKSCRDCPFYLVTCEVSDSLCWVYNKNVYSDEFLNQEVNMSILNDEEKTYLNNIIRPFKDRVLYLIKLTAKGYEMINIVVKSLNGSFVERECISLPMFHKHTIYKNMEAYTKYTLKDLELEE